MTNYASLTSGLSVTGQISAEDIPAIAARGFKSIINNRPDGEEYAQLSSTDAAAAAREHGLEYHYLPVVPGKITEADVAAFSELLAQLPQPVLAHCRSGTRSASLWALSEAAQRAADEIIATCSQAGYDLNALRPRLLARQAQVAGAAIPTYDVLVVGGGTAGISVAASVLKRRPGLKLAIIEPREIHYYQAGFTLVGGGAFRQQDTERPESSCIPKGAHWLHAAVAAFEPEHNRVVLEDGERIGYKTLVVCPGIKLDWNGVEGLAETLGKNNVSSNYQPGMARYTWQLIQQTRSGTALFTQPPMPIKCAGAPQKIMYLACDYWRRQGHLDAVNVEFNNAGGVLFGVKEFVPPLMKYVERYGIDLAFNSQLKAVDGPARKAWFDVTDADGSVRSVEKSFDMLHVAPPQCAPDVVRDSPLAGTAGWVDVDPESLRHSRYENIYSLGDVCSAPNAKTAAAVRKQAPVVAHNLLATLDGRVPRAVYDGYGSCPLIVERGKVILAEFGYGGKLLPSFPLDPTKPRRSMWLLKAKLLPHWYFEVLFKGREWGAQPVLRELAEAEQAVDQSCDWQQPGDPAAAQDNSKNDNSKNNKNKDSTQQAA